LTPERDLDVIPNYTEKVRISSTEVRRISTYDLGIPSPFGDFTIRPNFPSMREASVEEYYATLLHELTH